MSKMSDYYLSVQEDAESMSFEDFMLKYKDEPAAKEIYDYTEKEEIDY